MNKVDITRETLLSIAGYTPYTAKQLRGADELKKDLMISTERMGFLANGLSSKLRQAGLNKWIAATTLRADKYKVTDCVALMIQKYFEVALTNEQIKDLFIKAKQEL